MISPGRIPCINPRCARTSKADGAGEMICGKCFKALPLEMRRRDRQCRRRLKGLSRKIDVKIAKVENWTRLGRLHEAASRLFYRNWERMRRYYSEPERPAGLENFLKEIGL